MHTAGILVDRGQSSSVGPWWNLIVPRWLSDSSICPTLYDALVGRLILFQRDSRRRQICVGLRISALDFGLLYYDMPPFEVFSVNTR